MNVDTRIIEHIKWNNNRAVLTQVAAKHEVAVLLNPLSVEGGYPTLLAVGDKQSVSGNAGSAFYEITQLKKYADTIFGFLGYDVKNEIEALSSENTDGSDFPDYFFFQPKVIVRIAAAQLLLEYFEEDAVFAAQLAKELLDEEQVLESGESLFLQARITKEVYLENVNLLKKHIQRGDVYEVNFCQEFFSANAVVQPASIFKEMLRLSSTPFAAFMRVNGQHILCASPERFLQKQGNRVLSQPIKGTAKRGATAEEDAANMRYLSESSKEKSENVMIVDLVRNDLSTFAEQGSVVVEELFGIHTFPQWHQMISTVSCTVDSAIPVVEILKKCFPMGSMTGAPKLRALQLIEQYESMKRGVYSGAIGYIDAHNNFDFNVVIRSVLYNAERKYVSVSVGSAITANCDAAQEYDECLTKAAVLFKVLRNEG